MKRIFAFFLSLAVAAGVSACGDKGGGIVGTWTMDIEKAIDMGLAEAKKGLAKMTDEGQRKIAEEAMEGKAAREMMAKQIGGMKMEFVVSADKTFTASMQVPGDGKAEATTGTWEEKDGKYVFTSKTKNGQPVTGADAKAVDGKMVGANLVLGMPGGIEMAFKRK